MSASAGAGSPWVSRIRRALPGARAWKTALAAGVAWAVGSAVPGMARPYFAPLAAILTLQVTVAATVSRAAERVAGVVVGVVIALLFARLAGLTWWSIGLLVLASLTAGAWLRLGATGTPQVAVSALLVLIIGSLTRSSYAWARVLETIVGAAVGVAVNALVAPPDHLPEARQALGRLAEDTAAVLGALSGVVAGGAAGPEAASALRDARALGDRVLAATAGVERAEESLRWNPLGARRRRGLAALWPVLEALGRVAIEVRGIARTLAEVHAAAPAAAAPAPRWGEAASALAGLLAALGLAVERFWLAMPGPGREDERAAAAAAFEGICRQALEAERSFAASGPPAGAWLALGAILTDARRLVTELQRGWRGATGG